MKLFQRKNSPYYYADLRPWGLGKLSTGQRTVSAAKEIALKYLAKKGKRQKTRSEAISLSSLIHRYLAYSETNTTPQSYIRNKGLLKLFLEHAGDEQLSTLTPETIEAFKTERLCSVKPATINRDLNTIRAMLTKAVDWGFLKTSPCRSVKKLRVPQALPKFYSREEIDLLLEVSPERFRNIWLLFLYTGMRRGEALNLKWSDIRGNKIHVHNPKEGKEKIIPLSSQLEGVLNSMRQATDERVVPYESSYLTRTFNRLARKAGIGGNLHRLRHTVATFLLAKGVGINKVQTLLGHTSLSTTSTYTKVLESSLKEDIEKLKW